MVLVPLLELAEDTVFGLKQALDFWPSGKAALLPPEDAGMPSPPPIAAGAGEASPAVPGGEAAVAANGGGCAAEEEAAAEAEVGDGARRSECGSLDEDVLGEGDEDDREEEEPPRRGVEATAATADDDGGGGGDGRRGLREALGAAATLLHVWAQRERTALGPPAAPPAPATPSVGGGGGGGPRPLSRAMRRRALLQFTKTGDCFFKAAALFDAYCLHVGEVTRQTFPGVCDAIQRIVMKMDSVNWQFSYGPMQPMQSSDVADHELAVLKSLNWQVIVPSINCWTSLYLELLHLHLSGLDPQLRMPPSAARYSFALSCLLVQEVPASPQCPPRLAAAGIVCLTLTACGALPEEALGLSEPLTMAWRSVLSGLDELQGTLQAATAEEGAAAGAAAAAAAAAPPPLPAAGGRAGEVMAAAEASMQLSPQELLAASALAASALHAALRRRCRRQWPAAAAAAAAPSPAVASSGGGTAQGRSPAAAATAAVAAPLLRGERGSFLVAR